VSIEAAVKRKRKTRRGKGFSQDELSEAGLSFGQALRLGIPIDSRRRSKHKENVETLKKHLETAKEGLGTDYA